MIYNFSSSAIDDLLAQAKLCDILNEPKSASMYRTIASLLNEDAIKFALPDGGRLFESNKPFSPVDADLLHLPYPVIVLEYSMSDAHPITIHQEELGCLAPKRICLAMDDSAGDGITVIPIWFDENERKWAVSLSCVFIPRKQDHSPDSLSYPSDVEGKRSGLRIDIRPLIGEAWDRCVEAEGTQAAMRLGWLDAKDEVNNLLSFLLALSCTNVSSRNSEDEKLLRKVNAKRISKGKRPIFSYKILEIMVPKEALAKRDSAEGEFSRRSPRVHLRRGHVRRLSDGKRVWVNACVVGKKEEGIVHKDYKVTPVSTPVEN